MFIAGVVVGGAVVGVLAHDDYSRYSKYSRYGDANLVTEIAGKEAQKRNKDSELERIERELLSKYVEEISVLEDEPVLADKISVIKRNDITNNISNIDRIRNDLLVHIKNKLEKDLADDRKQLVEIDSALRKINEIQLTNKY